MTDYDTSRGRTIVDGARFPALAAAARSYEIVAKNFLIFARVAAVPTIVATLVVLGLSGSETTAVPAAPTSPDPLFSLWARLLVILGAVLASAGAVAFSWHRFILLSAQADRRFMFVAPGFIVYLVRGAVLLVALFVIPTAAVLFSAPFLPTAGSYAVGLSVLGLYLGLGLLAARLSLAFPGAALREPVTFLVSWRLTEGNSWRLFAGGFLTVVPTNVFGRLALLPLDLVQYSIPDAATLITAAEMIVFFAASAIGATYLSLAYRFFVVPEPQETDIRSLEDMFS